MNKNVLESFSLRGKVAPVTGGAGHKGGCGAQISEALHEAFVTGTNLVIDGGYSAK